jgi:hypothetical protein
MKKLIFLIIFVLYLFFNFNILKQFYFDFGDIALISLKVERAKEFKELLGPYSRMGFFHPGPILFYLYAFLGEIVKSLDLFSNFNSISAYYYIVQFLINFLFIVLIYISFPEKVSKDLRLLFILIFLFFWENINLNLPFSIMFDVWGPVVIILPFLLLIISITTFYFENHKYYLLFFLSLSLSIILSNHISGILYTAFFSLCLLIYYIYKRIIRINNKSIFWIGISILWFIIVFFPPIYEFFIHYPDNNIFRILESSLKVSSLRKGKEVLIYFGELLSIFFTGKSISILGWCFFISIHIVINICFKKINNIYLRFLYKILNIQTFLVLIYIFKIPYNLLYYLSWFYYVIVMLYIFIILNILFLIWSNKNIGIYINFLIIILIFFLGIRLFLKTTNKEMGFKKEFLVLEEINRHFDFKKDSIYKIYWGFGDKNHNNWVIATGIVLDLYRKNIPVCIDHHWEFMFGEEFLCRSNNLNIISISVNVKILS